MYARPESFGVSRDTTYARLVYTWLTVGMLISAATSWMTLNLGDHVMYQIEKNMGQTEVPSAVAALCDHPYMAMFLMFGLIIMAGVGRRIPGISTVAYLAFTAFSGAYIGPLLFVAQYNAAHHTTLSAHPIRDSFFMTAASFIGLSSYAWTTKRDFSPLAGFLNVGLWVIIAASIMAIFMGSRPFELAVDSACILLFSGFILFDTQKILNGDQDDAVGDALNIFLDVFNIFVRFLGILGSSKD
jgi:modulator of FtsH protease